MTTQQKKNETIQLPSQEEAEQIMMQLTLDYRLDYHESLESDVEWFDPDNLK